MKLVKETFHSSASGTKAAPKSGPTAIEKVSENSNYQRFGDYAPPTQPQPYAKERVKASFFQRGQLYGSLGESLG